MWKVVAAAICLGVSAVVSSGNEVTSTPAQMPNVSAPKAARGWVAIYDNHTKFDDRNVDPFLHNAMTDFVRNPRNGRLQTVAFTKDDSWVLEATGSHRRGRGVPKTISDALSLIRGAGLAVRHIGFTQQGGCAILYGKDRWWAYRAPSSVVSLMQRVDASSNDLKHVSFTTSGGWAVMWGRNHFYMKNVPSGVLSEARRLSRLNVALKSISWLPNGGWLILWGSYSFSDGGIDSELNSLLTRWQSSRYSIDTVVFSPQAYAAFGAEELDLVSGGSEPDIEMHDFLDSSLASETWPRTWLAMEELDLTVV